MKSIASALREMMAYFAPVGVVRRQLLQALDCVLAEQVTARVDLPPFDNSAMDGYALRCSDVPREGARLPVAGESRAGGAMPHGLPGGAAMRIFTGAPLPADADAVVIQEHTQRSGADVVIERLPRQGQNIRRRASDLARGQLALASGKAIGPGEIGLLAAQGVSSVSVYRPPRVAIVSTGDELRDIGEALEPGCIVNSNAYALAAQVAQVGAEPWVLPRTPDALPDLLARFDDALRADVVLSVGGVSVGDYDLVGQALERLGVERRFWKVAIKPGKPLMFGTAQGVPVVGLPGNPVSAMVTFEVFVRPGLRRMLGHRAPYPAPVRVELEHDCRHSTGRTELVRAVLRRGSDGRLSARLHPLQGSGSLPSMCDVDALLVLDADTEHFAQGSLLDALRLREGGAEEPPFGP